MVEKQIQWVWFDLDDTLHDFSSAARKATGEVFTLLSSRSGMPIENIGQNYRAALDRQNAVEFCDGRKSHDYRAERFRCAIGAESAADARTNKLIEETVSVYESVFMDNLQLKPHARETLGQLQQRGVSLAILSDAPDDAQERIIKRLGIDEFFSCVLTSGGMRLSKRKGLLKTTLSRLQTTPKHTVMVGNSLDRDIEPALEIGVGAIWFNDVNAPNEKSYREIHSLDQLGLELGLAFSSGERGDNG